MNEEEKKIYHNGMYEIRWEWIDGKFYAFIKDVKTEHISRFVADIPFVINNNGDANPHIADLLLYMNDIENGNEKLSWKFMNQ